LPAATSTFLESLRSRSGGLCVAVAGDSQERLWQNLHSTVATGNLFVELRLDALPQPEAAMAALQAFCAEHHGVIVLATCRRKEGGGQFAGSVEQQLLLLEQCAQAGASLVDVELETLEAAQPDRLRHFRGALKGSRTEVLVSAHDFAATGDLQGTLALLRRLGAPLQPLLYKVVTTATCLADNLRMLHFLEQASSETPIVGMCMGAAGVPSRVLALRSGAVFTFAAAEGTQGTAPGQLSESAMRGQYRVQALTAQTKIYGIAGNPVTHSLSPVLHNAGFTATGLDAVYLPLHTETVEDLRVFVQGLPVAGLSVTMPWKVAILPYLDAMEPEAARFGAVNTVVRRDDGNLFGTNTDLAAIVEPLEARMPLAGARILLLGSGGAARAAAFGLQVRGARVSILNRTRASAEALADESGGVVADPRNLRGYDAIVNATPAGMLGPAADELAVDPSALDDARVVFDMVYRPTETPLIRHARARGLTVITGDEMFLHQAAGQWRLWTRTPAPLSILQGALQAALSSHPTGTRRRKRESAMAKFEQIDRMIDQAVEGSSTAQKAGSADTANDAKAEQEAEAEYALTTAAAESSPPATALLVPKPTQAERTRQILGALRPFLPVVGGALRLIDHGAAQAASRLLPLLAGAGRGLSPTKQSENAAALEALEALGKERAALRADLDAYKEQLRSHEERLMKLRDALTRTLADQDTMQLSMRRLADRNRLLTAGLVILLMLVIAEIVLMQMNFHL
jgi:3-dehydroquinate dehydratase/shikimate dehydrogenase